MHRLAIVLVHYPILARDQSVVTTAITNLDIHDIARSAFTFGVERYYIVHPIAAQRELALRVKQHWTTGSGAKRIPDRRPPMECLQIVESLEEAARDWGECHQSVGPAETWVTSAQTLPGAQEHADCARDLRSGTSPVLLVFGTGWGLAPAVTRAASRSLVPITSPREDGYNHLSVRAAVAILLDRLLGSGDDG